MFQFSKNTPILREVEPNWLFDMLMHLQKSYVMNYKTIITRNQSNGNAGTKACDDSGQTRIEIVPGKDYILIPLWPADLSFSQNSMSSPNAGFKPSGDNEKKNDSVNNTNYVNTASDGNNTKNVNTDSSTINTAGIEVNLVSSNTSIELPNDPNMPELEDIVYSYDYEDVGAEADINNLNTFMPVSPIPTTRIHKDHPVEQIIRDLNSAPQTRRMIKNLEEHEPKKVIHALKDPSWIEAMQEEFLQFKLQEVWTLNKARLVSQGYTQEEGIDYDDVFAPVARIEAIRLFLAYTSFKDFMMYQMDVKSDFIYVNIEGEVYVCQPSGFEYPDFPDRVYKVEKALYGLHQAPRAWYETLSTYLLDNGFQRGKIDKTLFIRRDKGDILLVQVYVDDIIFGSTKKSLCTEFEKMMHKKFQMSSIGELTFFLGLQVKQNEDRIFISQDKYMTKILKKFGFTDVKTASTPVETQKQGFAQKIKMLQALVDGKKIIITEATVRRDLQLEDANGVDCLPNATILEQLTLIGAKTTTWNEFSSTMAAVIICLATNQKFNFSKYIFESMVKNLDNAGKFLMYPVDPVLKRSLTPYLI
ncbi:putative ribonuclease H-like domain-containing protein [Tanacetum coccineum]